MKALQNGATHKKRFSNHSQKVLIGLFILLGLFLVLSLIISISIGQVSIPLRETFQIVIYKLSNGTIGNLDHVGSSSYVPIIWQIRFPRAIMALLIGAGLSLCGVIMQATVQNPLADPYILGISSGASLGATFAILIGFGSGSFFSQTGVAFWAFAGALVASLIVFILAGMGGKMTSVKLVLSGMVISALCSAFSNFIIYFSNNTEGMKSVAFWTMGSLAATSWHQLPLLSGILFILVVFFLSQFRVLNTLLLGDEAATTLGIDLNLYRKIYMVLTALLTGLMVASCGTIGFVGLIIPHFLRAFTGANHQKLLPFSLIIGSLFLVWSDILARTMIAGVELPIGILTSLIGAPLFLYILTKKSYQFGG